MQTNRLTRIRRDGKAVHGHMQFGAQEIATLENDDYIIPAGTYPVRVTWSPKFKRMLPLLLNVPGRSGIRVQAIGPWKGPRTSSWFICDL